MKLERLSLGFAFIKDENGYLNQQETKGKSWIAQFFAEKSKQTERLGECTWDKINYVETNSNEWTADGTSI